MRKNFTQSITAYRCRICKKYGADNLISLKEAKGEYIELEGLLNEFFVYITNCKIDEYTHRAIVLTKPAEKEILDNSVTRLHIQPNAGRSFENFSVINHKTNNISAFNGDDNSAVYNQNVLIYISGDDNTFIFHRYGQSGCKTAFQMYLMSF